MSAHKDECICESVFASWFVSVHMYMHVYGVVRVHMYIHVDVCVCVYVGGSRTDAKVYGYLRVYACMHVRTNVCMCLCTQKFHCSIYICEHACMHTYIHTSCIRASNVARLAANEGSTSIIHTILELAPDLWHLRKQYIHTCFTYIHTYIHTYRAVT